MSPNVVGLVLVLVLVVLLHDVVVAVLLLLCLLLDRHKTATRCFHDRYLQGAAAASVATLGRVDVDFGIVETAGGCISCCC